MKARRHEESVSEWPDERYERAVAIAWRNETKDYLGEGFEVVHAYRGREEKETFPDPKGAIVRDKNDSDIMLMNDSFSQASMIGISMEVFFANELGKPIIAFGQAHKGDYWLEHHAGGEP
jgi:hypothetical protein